ncbi:MAG: cyclase family protein [Pseudomonadaceae bacterium]|nr:cyclase family protein [Pseudomonadaceae bacterium]
MTDELAEVTDDYCQGLWQSVCNWGRWGVTDELGALNLITPAIRASAAGSVTEGISIGCGNPWPVAPGPHNMWPAEHYMIRAGDDCDYPGIDGLSVSMDYIGVQQHGIACSHIDALCHVFVDHKMYNGFPASDVKSTGALKNDVRPMNEGIVGRGVLLDLPALLDLPYLPGDMRISKNLLEAAAARQNLELSSGDILLVHKGRQARVAQEGLFDPESAGMPGLHPECAELLHERGISLLGSDYMNDPQPNWTCSKWPIPIHYLGICGMGMTLLHNLDTQKLADQCSALQRWHFLLTIAPLKIAGATGSPVNPIAMF